MKIEIIKGADNNPVAEFFSSSSTPETDARTYVPSLRASTVPADFARKIERERNDLQKAVNGLCEHFGVSPANTTLLAVEVLKIERERDEARNECDKLKQLLAADSEGVDAYLGVCMERDEAREKYDLEATEHMLVINKLCNERDEALNKMADALQEVDLRTLDFERMKEERDDALSQIYQAECRAERFCQERDEARKTLGLA